MENSRPDSDRIRCRECGGQLRSRGYTHITKIGEATVSDDSGTVLQCAQCNTPALTLDDLQGYELRAAKYALIGGFYGRKEVMRFTRKALGFTQKELALVLNYRHETVSRWETGKEPATRKVANALVGLICRVLSGEEPEDIVATAHAEDEGPSSAPSFLTVPKRKVAC